jgi:hypothetical protein
MALSGRDDGGASRPRFRKVFGIGLLPSYGNPISPRKRAEGVGLLEVALKCAPPGATSLTRASPTGLGKHPSGLKFRGLDDLLAVVFEIDNRQAALGPVCTGENLPIGCHPNRRAASPRSDKALKAEYSRQNRLCRGHESGCLEELCKALPELLVAHTEPLGL